MNPATFPAVGWLRLRIKEDGQENLEGSEQAGQWSPLCRYPYPFEVNDGASWNGQAGHWTRLGDQGEAGSKARHQCKAPPRSRTTARAAGRRLGLRPLLGLSRR